MPSGQSIGFHSANIVNLQPGFNAQYGSSFIANIENSGFTCTQYPEGMIVKPRSNENTPYQTLEYEKYMPNSNILASGNPILHTDSSVGSVVVYPNPFNGNTTLQIFVPSDESYGLLRIIDLYGKEVSVLQTSLKAGSNYLKIDGQYLKSGCYLYEMNTSHGNVRGKMLKID